MIYFVYGMIVGSIIVLISYALYKFYKNYNKEKTRQEILFDNFIRSKQNDPNVNIFSKPTDAQEGLEFLRKILLGENWYVADPLPISQTNTYLVVAIAQKYMKGIL